MMNSTFNLNYQNRTYGELSRQFKELYPNVMQAFQLIAMMYNRLTLVDAMTHAEAVKKIYYDHRDLHGFSLRNIHRYLPTDNPNVPHRVVARRHKSSIAKSERAEKLSSTEYSRVAEVPKDNESNKLRAVATQIECPKCKELEQALLASSGCTRANNMIGSQIVYQIPKEKMYLITEALEKSDKAGFVTFDKSGNFVHAEADTQIRKQAVLDKGKNEKEVS